MKCCAVLAGCIWWAAARHACGHGGQGCHRGAGPGACTGGDCQRVPLPEPHPAAEDLVIIISQSGETSDTLAALKLAKSRGVPVLAIVNVVGSSIARAADYVMYTYAGPEIAVASTKAYMVQMCVLYLFALRLAYARGMQTDAEIRRLTAELLRAGEVIKPRLADCEQIKYLASRFVNTQSCFFIGRGFDYSLSLEGSLKLKEISYVHSDAYAAGELKHGTISLVTDGVPVIALATQKQVYEKDHLQRQGDQEPRRKSPALHHPGCRGARWRGRLCGASG